jgi:hypothetical protein
MGEPIYWPSDRNELPYLVDLSVTKGVPQDFAVAKSCFELSRSFSGLDYITSTYAESKDTTKLKI